MKRVLIFSKYMIHIDEMSFYICKTNKKILNCLMEKVTYNVLFDMRPILRRLGSLWQLYQFDETHHISVFSMKNWGFLVGTTNTDTRTKSKSPRSMVGNQNPFCN